MPVDPLDVRRLEERRYIDVHDTTDAPGPDGFWFFIDEEWLTEFRTFVMHKGPLPGSISNWRLLDATGYPRPNLQKIRDYRALNLEIWRYLADRYAGGPELRGKEVDIYSVEPLTPSAPASTPRGTPDDANKYLRACLPMLLVFRKARNKNTPADRTEPDPNWEQGEVAGFERHSSEWNRYSLGCTSRAPDCAAPDPSWGRGEDAGFERYSSEWYREGIALSVRRRSRETGTEDTRSCSTQCAFDVARALQAIRAMPCPTSVDSTASAHVPSRAIYQASQRGDWLAKVQRGSPIRFMRAELYTAVVLYTFTPICRAVNGTLRCGSVRDVKNYDGYLRLFLEALELLPCVKCQVYRGIAQSAPAYSAGDAIVWPAVSSTSRSPFIALQMANDKANGGGDRVIFSIAAQTGRDISEISPFPQEQELLLSPGAELQVESVQWRELGQEKYLEVVVKEL
mmetsp:Transcript_12386/g.27607  ORF Transcript_12386/g.27607 Transcript_12386/m.27607 type:complete len:455 (+) Transcript_12386:36-1400(+)